MVLQLVAEGRVALDAPIETYLPGLLPYQQPVTVRDADVNRFYRALLTGEILPAAQLTQMQQAEPAFPGFGYGLGLAGTEICGQRIWGHVGGAPGYLTYSFTRSNGERQITITVNRILTVGPAVEEAITTVLLTEFCGSPPAVAG